MSDCRFGPEWDTLKNEVGHADAELATLMNNGIVPSIEEAVKLLENKLYIERDESFNLSSEQFKVDRISSEIKTLEALLIKANPSQRDTIQKLINGSNDYKKHLLQNIVKGKRGEPIVKTISVTKFIGSSNFKGDPKEYEAYKYFGTFLHEVLETVQKMSIDNGVNMHSLLTKELFNEIHSNYIKKYPFQIERLTIDEMYDTAAEMLSTLSVDVRGNYILIPEVTTTGVSRTGAKVIGRIDLMLISPTGDVKIIDFKTKKLNGVVQKNPVTNEVEFNWDAALVNLSYGGYSVADFTKNNVNEGTAESFTHNRIMRRNTYDTWIVALDTYKNMLKQHGIDVTETKITVMFYSVDKTHTYLGKKIHVFDKQDYYEQAYASSYGSVQIPTSYAEKIIELKKAVNIEMPTGDTVDTEEKVKDIEDIFEITPSEVEAKRYISTLEKIIKGQQSESINRKKAEEEKGNKRNQTIIDIESNRYDNLRALQAIVDTHKHVSANDLKRSTLFYQMVDIIKHDLMAITESAQNTLEQFKNGTLSQEHVKTITVAYNKSKSLSQLIHAIDEIIVEASVNNQKLDANSPIRKQISDLHHYAQSIESAFREVSIHNVISTIQAGIGEKSFKAVTDDARGPILARIHKLEQDIEKLQSGEGMNVLGKFKHYTLAFFSKDYKQKLYEQVNPESVVVLREIESLQKKLSVEKAKLNGYNFDYDAIEKYINGVTDPDSLIYIGAQNVFSQDIMTAGLMMDDFIASASNSELGITAIAQLLKEAVIKSGINSMNDEKLQAVDEARKKALNSGMSLEEVNDNMSEVRTVVVPSSTSLTGMEEKQVLMYTKPSSEEYDRSYREFSIKTKQLTFEKNQLRAKSISLFDKDGHEEAKQAYLDKEKELHDYYDAYHLWLQNNASLPYTTEFYELQNKLPFEIRDEMQRLYHQRDILLYHLGHNDELILSEEELDELAEIELDIRRLREKAKQLDPTYVFDMDKFNDLYELERNDRLYKRNESTMLINFSDDPIRQAEWYKRNRIERANQAWYAACNELYEEYAMLFGEDDNIAALLEERQAIMRPHKEYGKFNPKYLSEEEIADLDAIENAMDEVIADKKANGKKMAIEEFEYLADLNRRKEQLITIQNNDKYTDLLKSKTKALQDIYNHYKSAQFELNKVAGSDNVDIIHEAQLQVNFYAKQFLAKEKEYAAWYNLNHYNTYKTILTGSNPELLASPKGFNKERVPSMNVREQYMETIPNPKYYTIKRLRKENWILNGERLLSNQIDELKENLDATNQLIKDGVLVIRPGAYNPNFLKGADGIPMPNSIYKDSNGVYKILPGHENNPNVNKNYIKLLNNPQLFDVYQKSMDLFFDLQKRIEGQEIGYLVPGFHASTIESMKHEEHLSDFFKNQLQIIRDKHLKLGQSEEDNIDNLFGDNGTRIRMGHSNQLPLEMQSKDALGSLMKYAVEAHYNIAMQQVAPQVDNYIDYLKVLRNDLEQMVLSGTRASLDSNGNPVDLQKRITELSKVIEISEYERRKLVYGQSDTSTDRKVKKAMGKFFAYTSFIRIGFDVTNQIKNYTSGNVQAFIAAGGFESNHYSMSDILYAKKKTYGEFLPNYFADWGNITGLHDSTILYRMMNPAMKNYSKYVDDISGGKTRRLLEKGTNIQELAYLLQDKGDTEIAVTVMYAVMHSYKFKLIDKLNPDGTKVYKLDANGNEIMVSAHDAYIQNGKGALSKRQDVDYTDEDEKQLRGIIWSEMRRAQGNYAKMDATRLEEKIIGKMLFFFKKFLIPQLLNRFGYLRPNWEGSEMAMGYWRATFDAMRYLGVGAVMKEFVLGDTITKKFGWTGADTLLVKDKNTKQITKKIDIGDFYQRKIQQMRQDAIAIALLTILGFFALARIKAKNDDDEELSMLEGNAIRILWGVKGETSSSNPFVGSSEDYIKNFSQVIPFIRELTAGVKLIKHAGALAYITSMTSGEEPDPSYDSPFYQSLYKQAFYQKKTGAYEQGDAKIMKDLVDFTGVKNIRDFIDPNYRIDQMKRNQ